MGIFIETDKLILKFIWKYKGPTITKTTLKKKSKFGRLISKQCDASIKIDNLMEEKRESRNRLIHIHGQLMFFIIYLFF